MNGYINPAAARDGMMFFDRKKPNAVWIRKPGLDMDRGDEKLFGYTLWSPGLKDIQNLSASEAWKLLPLDSLFEMYDLWALGADKIKTICLCLEDYSIDLLYETVETLEAMKPSTRKEMISRIDNYANLVQRESDVRSKTAKLTHDRVSLKSLIQWMEEHPGVIPSKERQKKAGISYE